MSTKRRILIADDDDLFRTMLTAMVGRRRPTMQCIEVRNGQEAYSYYQQHGADRILTDDFMPVMGGIPFIQTVRAGHAVLPIIVLAGQSTTRAALANDPYTVVVTKPINMRAVLALIDTHLTSCNARITGHGGVRTTSHTLDHRRQRRCGRCSCFHMLCTKVAYDQ